MIAAHYSLNSGSILYVHSRKIADYGRQSVQHSRWIWRFLFFFLLLMPRTYREQSTSKSLYKMAWCMDAFNRQYKLIDSCHSLRSKWAFIASETRGRLSVPSDCINIPIELHDTGYSMKTWTAAQQNKRFLYCRFNLISSVGLLAVIFSGRAFIFVACEIQVHSQECVCVCCCGDACAPNQIASFLVLPYVIIHPVTLFFLLPWSYVRFPSLPLHTMYQ